MRLPIWQALACQRANRNLTKAEWQQYPRTNPTAATARTCRRRRIRAKPQCLPSPTPAGEVDLCAWLKGSRPAWCLLKIYPQASGLIRSGLIFVRSNFDHYNKCHTLPIPPWPPFFCRVKPKGEKAPTFPPYRPCRTIVPSVLVAASPPPSPLFDVLAYVAYALPPQSRQERAARAKVIIDARFNSKAAGLPRLLAVSSSQPSSYLSDAPQLRLSEPPQAVQPDLMILDQQISCSISCGTAKIEAPGPGSPSLARVETLPKNRRRLNRSAPAYCPGLSPHGFSGRDRIPCRYP